MSIDPQALADLTLKMDEVGLPDPEAAAREELESGEPILATHSFLKWLTDEMVPAGDQRWIDWALKHPEHNPGLAPALEKLLGAGVDRDALTALVRVMQFRICDHVCYMLDQVAMPGEVPIQDFAVYHVGGGNSPTTDKPIARLEGLHELIGEWDPESESESEESGEEIDENDLEEMEEDE